MGENDPKGTFGPLVDVAGQDEARALAYRTAVANANSAANSAITPESGQTLTRADLATRVVAAGNLGASYQLNANRAADVLLTGTLNTNNALTFSNLVAGTKATIVLTQDATGGRTITVNAVAVKVNSAPASVTVLKIYSPNGSTVYIDAPGVLASPYRQVIPWRGNTIAAGTTLGTYAILSYNGAIGNASDQAGLSVVYLDPADYMADSNKVLKYRLRAVLQTNATSIGTNTLTAGLYPITASAGGAGVITMTTGTVVTGSTAAFVNPATSSILQANSTDFTAPALGFYALQVNLTATTAASSRALLGVTLETHEV